MRKMVNRFEFIKLAATLMAYGPTTRYFVLTKVFL